MPSLYSLGKVRVLAVDTATPYLVLGTPEAELALRAERRQGEMLVPVLERFLDRAGLEPGAIEGVAAGQGPGSYTGLRVGLAFAQGLARALGVPFVGASCAGGRESSSSRPSGRLPPAASSTRRPRAAPWPAWGPGPWPRASGVFTPTTFRAATIEGP